MKTKFFIFFFIFIIAVSSVYGQLKLPDNIAKIKEYNQDYFSDFSLNVTFFIAFLAGILGIFSPCILPLLPAYFSYTFKEKKNITLMTFVFFLGFSLMFIIMGVIAGYLGQQTLGMIQSKTLIRIAALFILMLGIMSFFGKSFTFIKINYKTNNDIFGVFLFGILFAISWTGCLGPMLSGILGIGAVLGNYVESGILLFFYGLGNFVPLFILAVFYDKLNLQKFTKGKFFEIELFNKKFRLNTISVLSGILLMGSAVFLLIYGNTKLFNSIDPFATKMMFYDYQNMLMKWASANVVSIVVFAVFVVTVGIFLWKRNSR